ncbi:MAG: hypothetical protein CMB80_03330, partial [Flammeovirgaceae bacterium]|nr:hypothetical protein [Flammeovirgaceae bacterium]
MAGTYNPYGPGGIVWSSAGPTPFEDPTSQILNLAVGAGLTIGAVVGLQNWSAGKRGGTAFDLVQKTVRNLAMSTPFGLGNTFRAAEFMSPGLSATGQGLQKGISVSTGKPVSVFSIGPEYTTSAATKRTLKAVVGEQAYTKSGLNLFQDGAYELRFEREAKGTGRGSLFTREVRYDPHTRKVAGQGAFKKISDAVNLF